MKEKETLLVCDIKCHQRVCGGDVAVGPNNLSFSPCQFVIFPLPLSFSLSPLSLSLAGRSVIISLWPGVSLRGDIADVLLYFFLDTCGL